MILNLIPEYLKYRNTIILLLHDHLHPHTRSFYPTPGCMGGLVIFGKFLLGGRVHKYSETSLQRTPLYSGHHFGEPITHFPLKFTSLQRTPRYSGHLFREPMVSAIERFHCIRFSKLLTLHSTFLILKFNQACRLTVNSICSF